MTALQHFWIVWRSSRKDATGFTQGPGKWSRAHVMLTEQPAKEQPRALCGTVMPVDVWEFREDEEALKSVLCKHCEGKL